MASHERTQTTNAPPARVWALWSDVSTWPRWNPDVKSISLDGPFRTGAAGTMTTGAGTHDIHLENVADGGSFDLVTSPAPASTFHFHCEVTPSGSGSRISQGVRMSGPLGWLFSLLMGGRIAKSFEPILAGLAKDAENA